MVLYVCERGRGSELGVSQWGRQFTCKVKPTLCIGEHTHTQHHNVTETKILLESSQREFMYTLANFLLETFTNIHLCSVCFFFFSPEREYIGFASVQVGRVGG